MHLDKLYNDFYDFTSLQKLYKTVYKFIIATVRYSNRIIMATLHCVYSMSTVQLLLLCVKIYWITQLL